MYINKANISPTQLFDKQINTFFKQVKNTNNAEYINLIRQLKSYENKSKKLGLGNGFNYKLYSLAENLFKSNKLDFANIIYSYLIKIPTFPIELKEKCINHAINISKSKEDVIHLLARYVDLGKLYRQTNKSKKLQLNCLLKQEKLLTQIITKPQKVFARYNTVSKDVNSLDTYKLKLAMTKVDIAKLILRTYPQKAKNYLVSAKSIFEKFNRIKEKNFVDTLLSEITTIN